MLKINRMSAYTNKVASMRYHINGTGRDTYIQSNNGGFSQHHKGSVFPQPGTFRQSVYKSNIHHNKYAPTEGKKAHYIQNGGGRDSYILMNHGGFTSPNLGRSSNNTFYTQLRSYNHSPQMRRSPSNTSISSRD